jgi:hypothetical protein
MSIWVLAEFIKMLLQRYTICNLRVIGEIGVEKYPDDHSSMACTTEQWQFIGGWCSAIGEWRHCWVDWNISPCDSRWRFSYFFVHPPSLLHPPDSLWHRTVMACCPRTPYAPRTSTAPRRNLPGPLWVVRERSREIMATGTMFHC